METGGGNAIGVPHPPTHTHTHTPVIAAFKYVEIVYILVCYSYVFVFTRCFPYFLYRSGEAAVDYGNIVVAMLDERREGVFLKPFLDFSLLFGLPLMQT